MMPERRERLQTMVRGLRKLFPRWLSRPDPNFEDGMNQWLNSPQGQNIIGELMAVQVARLCLGEMLPEVDGSVLETEFRAQAPQILPGIIRRIDPNCKEEDIAYGLNRIESSLEEAIKRGWIVRDGEYIGFGTRAALITEGTRVVQRVIDEG